MIFLFLVGLALLSCYLSLVSVTGVHPAPQSNTSRLRMIDWGSHRFFMCGVEYNCGALS